jgi:hypothetical protein
MALDLTRLDPADRLHNQVKLARSLQGVASLEAAAQVACRHFYEELTGPGELGPTRACVLVRCFKTHPYGSLEPDLQECARQAVPEGRISGGTPCLVLVASIGDEPAWCSRHLSRRRRCIPLESPAAVERAPMWSRFFRETGVDTAALFGARSPEFVDRAPRAVEVFCVEEAAGSASIPDQEEFVARYGVRSVFGFCSQLRRGDLYVLVMFSRVSMTRERAGRLRPLALDVTSTFFRLADTRVFTADSAAGEARLEAEATQ